jgi:hypothetical protein
MYSESEDWNEVSKEKVSLTPFSSGIVIPDIANVEKGFDVIAEYAPDVSITTSVRPDT